MSLLNMQFTADDLKDDFQPLPAGNYVAQIANSEIKQSKNGDNYLSLEWEILDGEYTNRKIFQSLNLWNPNPVAVSIAKKDLAKISMAILGRDNVGDSGELHYRPIKIRVAIKKDKNGVYADRNAIKGYEALANQARPNFQTQQPQSQGYAQVAQGVPSGMPQPTQAPQNMPWARQG